MRRAFAFLKSNDIELRNGVPHPTIEPHDILQEDIDAHCFPDAAADPDAVRLQRLHDLCLVRPSEIQGEPAGAGRAGELGHRLRRILAGGAGQPLGQRGVFGGAAQDHAGGDHAGGVRLLLGALSEGAAGMESRARFSLHRYRRVSDLPQMGDERRHDGRRSITSRPAPPAIPVRSNCPSAATARRPAPGGRP